MNHCEDCGSRVYGGACTNCHEPIFIEQQYHELDMRVPDLIKSEVASCLIDIGRKTLNNSK